ncbi:MAG TPA: OmpA family protein [Haliangium sp.]|nr:OmpA family protein [Haliangium sp.]
MATLRLLAASVTAVLAAVLMTACGAANPLCKPVNSWSGPVYRCAADPNAKPPEPEPEPEPPAPEPEPEPERAVLREDKIEIRQAVQFEFGKAVLLDESKGLLDEVAGIIKEHPDIKKVRVEGHTDNVGGKSFNQRLSQQRAQSVREYLISQGVEPKRLLAQGYGMDKPIDTNDTEEGRAKNRRVEFNIVERDPPPAVQPE